MKNRWMNRALVAGTAGVASVALLAGAAVASANVHQPRTVFVSHGGGACPTHHVWSINAAIQKVATGGTVVVCRGTYNEDAVVTKPLKLIGRHATINPSAPVNQTNSPLYSQAGNNGITVLAPWVKVAGFTVTKASGDGIFVVGNHAQVLWNTAVWNGGTGVDLNGSSWSLVKGNLAANNTGGGFYLTNDAGAIYPGATASHDWIVGNVARDNPLGCGVILADHLGNTVSTNKGIFANVVAHNVLVQNGDQSTTPDGAGAGVVLASPVPGGAVWNNLVTRNTIRASGLAGVTVHSHVPGQHFGGNRITWNSIGTNNVTGDFGDPFTTGVFVGSVDPMKIVVAHNLIHDNHFGIFTAGSVWVVGKHQNAFVRVAQKFGHVSPYAG